MRITKFTVLSWVVFAGLLIGLVAVVRQHLQISNLVDAHEQTANRLETSVASLREQLAEQGAQLSRIERAMKVEGGNMASASSLKLDSLDQGVYVLLTKVADGEGDTGQPITIYHLSMIVGVRDFSRKLHLGVATAGITFVPRFYIDYDNDGRVDMDMLNEFAEPFFNSIPGAAWLLSDSIDSDSSQEIYTAFLTDAPRAELVSLDQVTGYGGDIARSLWEFVESQSEALADWILQTTGVEAAP